MAKDRKIDMVILGLLAHENLTGYDIKKKIDNGISFFWKGSFGSIYPSLNAMVDDGYIEKLNSEDKSGGREKIFYQITESGREYLKSWLLDSKATNDLKYETLLKVFFGGSAEPKVTLNTISMFEREISEELEILRLYRDNLSQAISDSDHIYFYLTVTFGVETFEGYLRWCNEAKELLTKNEKI